MVVCRSRNYPTDKSQRPSTNDAFSLLPLKVNDDDCLKGLRFSLADIGTVTPLFHRLHSRACEGGVSFDQPQTLDLACFIDYRFEDDGAFAFLGARFRRIFWRYALEQAFLRTLGGKNNCSLLTRKWCARWRRGRSRRRGILDYVFFRIARIADGWGRRVCACRSWRSGCGARRG